PISVHVKIAFVGKGGSGKTTLAALFARQLVASGPAGGPPLQRRFRRIPRPVAGRPVRPLPRIRRRRILPLPRCVDRLAGSLAVTGARRLLLMVEGTDDPGRTRHTIARLGDEVLPTLRP